MPRRAAAASPLTTVTGVAMTKAQGQAKKCIRDSVYAVAGGEASRVADAGQVIAAVVLVAGLAGGGVGDLAQAVEGVVGEGAALVQGCLLYTSRCV